MMANSQGYKAYIDDRYPLSAETAKILAAASEVHRHLGPGFEEVIYQRALARELPAHGLEYSREVWMDVLYKGEKVGSKRVDCMIGSSLESVMVEIKAKARLEDVDSAQALSYLKASGCRVGMLLTFGSKELGIKRLAN